jgi:DNA modification methylase
VLDPFAGSATVSLVAQKLGRHSVGVDKSEEYLALAQRRIEALSLPMEMGVQP